MRNTWKVTNRRARASVQQQHPEEVASATLYRKEAPDIKTTKLILDKTFPLLLGLGELYPLIWLVDLKWITGSTSKSERTESLTCRYGWKCNGGVKMEIRLQLQQLGKWVTIAVPQSLLNAYLIWNLLPSYFFWWNYHLGQIVKVNKL